METERQTVGVEMAYQDIRKLRGECALEMLTKVSKSEQEKKRLEKIAEDSK